MSKSKKNANADIFQLLLEKKEEQGKIKWKEILKSLKVKEFFEDGSIRINDRTCQGLECELCIKACPTRALYWQDGKVGIIKDLCVYCGACVLCCIVDDCITVTRKRTDGTIESFSKPGDVAVLFNRVNSRKRHQRVKGIFPDDEAYLKRCRKMKPV